MNRVLFIHIPKCGGTTIRAALDIRHIPNAQNLLGEKIDSGRLCFQHGSMDFIKERQIISKRFLRRGFIFSFTRNPYDRVVSHYFYAIQKRRLGFLFERSTPFQSTSGTNEFSLTLPFLEFTRTIMNERSNYRSQSIYLGENRFNFIGKLENINEDLKRVCEMLGEEPVEVPHLNTSKRPKDYREVYCQESKERVEEFYAEDFKRFGYELEDF